MGRVGDTALRIFPTRRRVHARRVLSGSCGFAVRGRDPTLVDEPSASAAARGRTKLWAAVPRRHLDGAEDEIVTGPGSGPSLGPHVRGWKSDGTAMARVSYYAYGIANTNKWAPAEKVCTDHFVRNVARTSGNTLRSVMTGILTAPHFTRRVQAK